MDFKSKIIQEVFENKIKSDLTNNSKVTFADGGKLDNEIYSPKEFLNTFLKIVSVDDGAKLDSEIEKLQIDLDVEIGKTLDKYRVNSIFMLPIEELEKIEVARKNIEYKKKFITIAELNAYLICNPNIPLTNFVDSLTFTRDELIERGLIMLDIVRGNTNWVYKWEYLSGNIQEKISRMQQYSEEYSKLMPEQALLNQINLLEKTKNPLARITQDATNKIYLSPSSFFASDRDVFTVQPDDFENFDRVTYPTSIKEAFKIWLNDETEVDATDFKNSSNAESIIGYYVDNTEKGEDKTSIRLKSNALKDGEIVFKKFLNTKLNQKCKQRLEYVWNAKFNNYVEPIKYKIPIALSCAKKWKKDSDFRPNEPQVQSVQFMNSAGSGLLAYGVGVGKTASAILNVSYAFDNNFSKKALFVVPNATYEKWISEINGLVKTEYTLTYTENSEVQTKVFAEKRDAERFSKNKQNTKIVETTINIKGILPHFDIVGLENLNDDVVYRIKNYTEKEQQEIAKGEELMLFLNGIPKDYEFNDSKINNQISELYGNFELNFVKTQYEYYKAQKDEKKERPAPIFTWWKSSVNLYVKGLRYKLGTLKEFKEKSIFVTTIEGLDKLGVEELTMQERAELTNDNSFISKIYKELRQGDSYSYLKYSKNGSNSFSEQLELKMYGGVDEPKVFLKDFGIDYVVFDESHAYKKAFVEVKGKPESVGYSNYRADGGLKRNTPKYKDKKGGSASQRALSGYIISRYVQEKNNNRNVLHLTATPFTNSPLEVYSMMAITNYKRLVEAGFEHIEDFYDTYMKIDFQFKVGANNKVKFAEILAGYHNTPQLRGLIYSMMDYKNGDDANIKRPLKIMYPSIAQGRDTVMLPNDIQEEYFSLIRGYIAGILTEEEVCSNTTEDIDVKEKSDEDLINILESQDGYDKQKDKYSELELPLKEQDRLDLEQLILKIIEKDEAESVDESKLDKKQLAVIRVLKGMNMLKQVTLSPYLFSCRKKTSIEPTYKEYVETSPKLLYIVNCIKTIKDYETQKGLKKSGSVIYMNIGVHPSVKILQNNVYVKKKWNEGGFDKIKKYLVKEFGYNEDEISIVKGSMNRVQKETEKNKFLAGESLVIIGSSTISTGVDLQNNASSLFLASFDYNPTDNEQINGRIYRQGNSFSKIRIVYPMVENSSDPLIFQLLQEKTMRIKEIWDREGKTGELSLEDFDPSRLKEELLTDPKTKTELWYEKKQFEILNRIDELKERLNNTLVNASTEYSNLINYRKPMMSLLTVIDAFRKNLEKQSIIKKVEEKTKDINSEFESKKIELLEKLQSDPTFGVKYAEEFEKAKNKFVTETEKVKKDFYDYEFDPERRFVVSDYFNLKDDELVNELNDQVIYNQSWLQRNQGDYYSELNSFVNDKYNNYYNGKYFTEEELNSLREKYNLLDEKFDKLLELMNEQSDYISKIKEELNFDDDKIKADERIISATKKYNEYRIERINVKTQKDAIQDEIRNNDGAIKLRFNSWGGGVSSYAITFKDAVKNYNKLANKLRLLGIKVEDVDKAKEEIKEQLENYENELTKIDDERPRIYAQFLKEFDERRNTAPSVLYRVDEFSDANEECIVRDLVTFEIDKQKPIKIDEKVKIKPIVEEPIKIIETDTIKKPKFVEEQEELENNDLKFLENKLKATEDLISLLEMTDEDSNDLVFLNELKIATKDLISLLELA